MEPQHLSKRIHTHADLHDFQNSESFLQLTTFLDALVDSVKGKPEWNDSCPESLEFFASLLQKLNESLDTFNLKQSSGSRFGNPLFREWYASQALPAIEKATLNQGREFREYLCLSFGNLSRLDYGTGHELNFIASLYCLSRELKEFDLDAKCCFVLLLFRKYTLLMHKILRQFLLEPAGSHGVWGLDDFYFLPYLFGASQLTGHSFLRPKSISNQDCIEMYREKNFYLLMISFLQQTKHHSLAWNSPMLYDLTILPSWEKIVNGLSKMYKSEVLGKLPIMQHFYFGSIHLSFQPLERDASETAKFQVHEFQSCCANIKIPSIYYTEEKELPFD
jgi:serine/threonine-protein phosphatase 2A activator